MAGNGKGRVRPYHDDIPRTGPGTLAGRYLRSFWQPVHRAEDLRPGRAKPIKVMGEELTLYRGETGTPHLVAPRCPHRGAQLSIGQIEGDCLRCFYHGWKFDASGRCLERPAEPPSTAAEVRIASYPIEEYLGLLFAYLGEGSPPPLPRYPFMEAEGVLEVDTYVRDCNYFQNVENSVDEVHVSFVHRGTGFDGIIEVPRVSGEESDYGITCYGQRSKGQVRLSHFIMPNGLYIKIPGYDPRETDWRDYMAWRVAIDDDTHMNFGVNLVHIAGEAADSYREQRQERLRRIAAATPAAKVAADILAGRLALADLDPDYPDLISVQDHVAQIGQGTTADRQAEYLGQSDAIIALLRKIWVRELKKLAKGEPLKHWAISGQLATTSGE